MATEMVRVWLEPDEDLQHFAVPPEDDTSRQWEGETACGAAGTLRWITLENVDAGRACGACATAQTLTPPLEGDHPGPV